MCLRCARVTEGRGGRVNKAGCSHCLLSSSPPPPSPPAASTHHPPIHQNCATLPVQISVLLRPGDVNKDVFICVDEMPEDTVKAVPLQLIKDLMRKRRLSVSGSKVELVRRMRLALTGRFSM
jgi:hypothetical protein